jgi:N-acetylmuramoyl-L-alanine amidase
MKATKRNQRIVICLVLIPLLIFSACSKNEKETIVTSTNPIDNNKENATNTISPTKPVPTDAAEIKDTKNNITMAPNDLAEINTGKSNIYTPAKKIAIDAGHQSIGNNEKEPIGPNSSISKPKVSFGTQGVSSGVAEYELNLTIALKLKEELRDRGYDIFMIRETNDVDLSNKERAEMANESGSDLFIRIHADSSTNPDVTGTSTLYPSEDNPYVSNLSKDSYALSIFLVDAICEQTGSKNRGAIARDDMSGINWCSLPVSIIEMGFLSNQTEDTLMQTEEYQDKIVQGISDGIDNYFE